MPPRAKPDVPADPVQAMMAEVNQQFGAGSMMELGTEERVPVEVIPSGSIALDLALGIGGLPRGRVVEIYGPEGSGKTTLALHAIANAQRSVKADGRPGVAVMIDAEHALDKDYAAVLGVDVDHLLLSQPDTGEQGLEIADIAIRSGVVDIVVIDSVAALVPRAEIEGMMGDSHMGLHARLMSQALRKITGSVSKTNTLCIFINQLREKIGVVFGNPEVTTGGKALKFYASVRLDVRKSEAIKDGSVPVGHNLKIKTVKNKLAPPLREVIVPLLYGRGISRAGEVIDLGVETGVITKAGAYYSIDGQVIGQGKDKARIALEACPPDTLDTLEWEIKARLAAAPAYRPPSAMTVAPRLAASELVGSGSLAEVGVPPGGNDPETQ